MQAGLEVTSRQHRPRPGWEILSAEQALLAFPLVVAVDGPVHDLPGWRQTVATWLRRGPGARGRRGIVALRTGLATIFSVFFFSVRCRGLGGDSLCVPRVWLVEIGAPGRVPSATYAAIEQLAHRLGCTTIAIELDLRGGPAREVARALHRVDAAQGDGWPRSPADPSCRSGLRDRPGTGAGRCRDGRRR